MNYELRFKKPRNSGYTIIETMIAVSLFIIIVMTGMDALLNANLLHQKSQNMRSLLDSLSFTMEDISRNLRTGYNYHCISVDFSNLNLPASGANCWGIAFEYQNGGTSNPEDQWVYYIGPDTSLPGNPGAIWKSTVGPYTPSSFYKLTPDEVVIDYPASYFTIIGAEPPPEFPGPDRQPFVTIKLVGQITLKNVTSPFTLQTSVSQRQIDIN